MARKKSPAIKPPNRRRPVRPPRLPTIAATNPRGPKWLQIPKAQQQGTTGPGEPPAGFVTATNSVSEYWVYWALFKILVPNQDPRKPPFVGWPGVFQYQVPFLGGRNRSGGGNIIDFTVEACPATNDRPVAIRLQTYHYHGATDSVRQSREQLYKSRLSNSYRVVDVWEMAFLNDRTGQAVIIQVKNALRGVTPESPLRGGTLNDVRDRPKGNGS